MGQAWAEDLALGLGPGALQSLATLALRSGVLPSRLEVPPRRDVFELKAIPHAVVVGDQVSWDCTVLHQATHGYAAPARTGTVAVRARWGWSLGAVTFADVRLDPVGAGVVRAWGLDTGEPDLDLHVDEALAAAWPAVVPVGLPGRPGVSAGPWQGATLARRGRVAPAVLLPELEGDATLVVGASALRAVISTLDVLGGRAVTSAKTAVRAGGVRVALTVGGESGEARVSWCTRPEEPVLAVHGDVPWAGALLAHLEDAVGLRHGRFWFPVRTEPASGLHDDVWALVGAPDDVLPGDGLRLSLRVVAGRGRVPLPAALAGVWHDGAALAGVRVRTAREEVDLDLARARAARAAGTLAVLSESVALEARDRVALRAAGLI